jgi:histone acetyltransferase (RNA polymerase elongator complex component)
MKYSQLRARVEALTTELTLVQKWVPQVRIERDPMAQTIATQVWVEVLAEWVGAKVKDDFLAFLRKP